MSLLEAERQAALRNALRQIDQDLRAMRRSMLIILIMVGAQGVGFILGIIMGAVR